MVARRLGSCCVDVGYLGLCRNDWIVFQTLTLQLRMPARARVAEGGRELCEPDGVSRRTAALLLLLRDAAERWRRRVVRRRINF